MTRTRTGRRALLAAAIALGTAAAMPAAAQTDVVLGTSSVGGSYYLYGGGLSSWTQRGGPLRITARTTRGSVENARLLHTGQMQFGFANAGVLHQQRAGEGQFANQASERIRAVVLVDIAPLHWVALTKDNIRVFRDLSGKRVSIGAAGSGNANTTLTVLDALGLRGSIRQQLLGFDESANNLRDGNLEAFSASSAIPMPAVSNLATTRDITLLSLSPQELATIIERNPAFERTVIPANTYRGVATDVVTVGTPSALITHAGVPEEQVYQLTRIILQADVRAHMKTVYNAWDPGPGRELFSRINVPLHPGAERAMREAGVLR
ncbi:MAG: TAXI family TRAP transporter solute-binding subunit [Alphaproteobacteria bacterium]|nr:TAXI family TRAP transporter solute-binding subunit [Alphaproteobacteria bacterium]